MKLHNLKVTHLLKADSIITHMKGNEGNESLINREEVIYNGNKTYIPVLSGNATRHSMIRNPGSKYLIDYLKLEGKMNPRMINFMLNGGALTQSSGDDNTKVISGLHDLFPLYYLLGGCLPSQIISGSMISGRGKILCEETREYSNKILPDDFKIEKEINQAEYFVGDYQYTRHDKLKNNINLLENIDVKEIEKESNQMIYNGQCIIEGTLFLKQDILQDVSELEIGAYFHALQQWQAAGGIVGGMSRIGHGKMSSYILIDSDIDVSNCVHEYINHVAENKESMIEWLMSNMK